APGLLDVDHVDHTPRTIDFDVSETKRLLGKGYGTGHVSDVLKRLGFQVSPAAERTPSPAAAAEGTLHVSVPSWRLDVRQSADLVEEVARITGYDDLPVTMPEGVIPQAPAQPPEWAQRMALEDRLREILQGAGFSETVTYSLLSEQANRDV